MFSAHVPKPLSLFNFRKILNKKFQRQREKVRKWDEQGSHLICRREI